MDQPLLIATLSPMPAVRLISWPTTHVEIGQESFEEMGAGDTNGFYDFLRRTDGRIVGVRFAPFVEHAHICDSATSGPRLRITGVSPFKAAEIFFGTEQDFAHASSGDQFLDWNYLFRSNMDKYAFTFGVSHLSKLERDDLLSLLSKIALAE